MWTEGGWEERSQVISRNKHEESNEKRGVTHNMEFGNVTLQQNYS
jgi:hypothetical protein